MEKTGCKVNCGAPTTLEVKELMMMMMMKMLLSLWPAMSTEIFFKDLSDITMGNLVQRFFLKT